jgi:hypothetical protein
VRGITVGAMLKGSCGKTRDSSKPTGQFYIEIKSREALWSPPWAPPELDITPHEGGRPP